MTLRVVILGAGPTGLGTAYRLAELGHENWDVYERADHVGGLASSIRDPHGFIWDHGGHVMFSHYSYFDELVEKLLEGDYDQHLREAWVWIDNRFVPYPFQNNIHRLRREAFVDCLRGIIRAQSESRPKTNFLDWVKAVFGDELAATFMIPYNLKVWAHPLETMGVQWQGDRVPHVDVRAIIDNLIDDRDEVGWGPNNRFKFPLLGTGMLYDRMAASLPKPVQLRKEATAIDPVAKVVTFRDGTESAYDRLVTTMPLPELARCLVGFPAELHDAVAQLHHTEGLFVGIGVRDTCPSTKCWMYFPESSVPFYRVTYLSNYSPYVTPGPGHFSLLGEVSSSPHKPEARDDVVERVIDGMVSCGLLTEDQARYKIVSRQLLHVPYSYPVPTLGRDRALEVIQPWLMDQHIYSRGRFGAWRYEIGNTDHSVMMGVELADHLIRGANELTWALLPGEEAKASIA